jgi:tRNA pseudouridine13 synthase
MPLDRETTLTELTQPLPCITADQPGLGGRIKTVPEDFEVEEIPAYEPCGTGEFLFLWVEKRDLGAEYFARQVARRLGIPPEEIGTAGLKDRRAVARQWISVPATVESRLAALDGDGIRLLRVSRHGNKLKPGHLHGNRFSIRIRELDEPSLAKLEMLLETLRQRGLPNFYGEQRFGQESETLQLGLQLLGGEESEPRKRPGKFLRKLALSAVQSALFNRCLASRMQDGLLHRVLPGDVMAKWPAGGMFVAEDVATEQARFDCREIVHTGPMFGKKMFAAAGQAAEREQAVLEKVGLSAAAFHGFGKLLQGTRRHNLVWLEDLVGQIEGADARITFTLPAGSYATVLLHEVTKQEAQSPPAVER